MRRFFFMIVVISSLAWVGCGGRVTGGVQPDDDTSSNDNGGDTDTETPGTGTDPTQPIDTDPVETPVGKITTLALSAPRYTVAVGYEREISATSIDSNGLARDVGPQAAWGCVDNTIATVHAGKVTGISPGRTFITSSFGGVSGHTKFSVVPPPPISGGTRDDVLAMALASDGTLYFGGYWLTWVSGQTRSNLAAIDTAGLVTPWEPSVYYGMVDALVVSSSTVYVGGTFTQADDITVTGLIAVDRVTGAIDPTLTNGLEVYALAQSSDEGTLYVSDAGGLWRIDLTQPGFPRSNVTVGGTINVIVERGGILYVGGSFSSVNGVAANNLAALFPSGLVAEKGMGAVQPVVTGLVLDGDHLYGTGLGSTFALDLSNEAGGNALLWDLFTGYGYTIAYDHDVVYVGGTFTDIGGYARERIAALVAATGAVVPTWDPGSAEDGSAAYGGVVGAIVARSDFVYFQQRNAADPRYTAMVRVPGPNGAPPITDTNDVVLQPGAAESIAYLKATNAESGDMLGYVVAMSSDGNAVVVGAPTNGYAGKAFVFERVGGVWMKPTHLTASNAENLDLFGSSVALSGDGLTLAVGAPREASGAKGIGGDQSDNSANGAGAVYVFRKDGGVWHQTAYVKATNPDATDAFGTSVALSGDGLTLAVGAPREASAATTIDGDQSDNTVSGAGAVYVFTFSSGAWAEWAYLKASGSFGYITFGSALSLSSNGRTLAVAASRQGEWTTGLSGAIYVFEQTGGAWQSPVMLRATNPADPNAETASGSYAELGCSLALSADGNTIAAGAMREIGRSEGRVYVFTRTTNGWTQSDPIRAETTEDWDFFGRSVALNADGSKLAIGASGENGYDVGLGGDPNDDLCSAFGTGSCGAAYIFTRGDSGWTESSYVKASNTEAGDGFGVAIALNADGLALAVGATHEDGGGSLGVGDDPNDNSVSVAGAVYVY